MSGKEDRYVEISRDELRFVLVVWLDHSGWNDPEWLRNPEESKALRPVERVTTGFVTCDAPDYINIASTVAWTIGHLSKETCILKSAIVTIREYDYTLPTLDFSHCP